MAPPPPHPPPPQRSPGGASSSSYSGAPSHHYANAPPPPPPGNSLPPLRHPPPSHMDEQRAPHPRERWWQHNASPPPPPSGSAAHRSDVMSMNSILGGGAAMQDDLRAAPMRYDRERERERDRGREREWEWERERERERARASHYAGPPGRQPPPSPGSRQDGARSPVASFNAATSPGRRSDVDEAVYHRDREWEREREREMDRDRELRWRASQRPGAAASDMGSSSNSRRPSGDVRYGMGPEPPRSPQESYPPSMAPRKSPIAGHPAYASAGRVTPSGAPSRTHARQPSGDMPLPPIGRESPPRHAAYASHYDDPRAPSSHGGMPPPHRSPERMRPPLPHGAYDPLSEREREREYEREMRMLDRDRELMAPTDRYGRRIHPSESGAAHIVMDDAQMYDRYGPRGPPSGGPPGPPSSARSANRGYDDRGPPPLPYPPSSPTQSRDHDRIRKDQGPPPMAVGRDRDQPDYHSRESSAPALTRHRDDRGPPPPLHYDQDRPLRSGPPPLATGPSTKLEPGVDPPVVRRPTTLSPTTERGAPFREAPPPPHRGPSMPPYAPADRDPRERDMAIPPRDLRDLDFAQQEREREHMQHLEREQRAQQQQLERERREQELELERERSFQEKEASREKKERRREKQQAEKNAAAERERQAQAQAQAQAAPNTAGVPVEQSEVLHGRGPPPASLEEALIITAQQHAAAYGRAPTLADFQQAAAAVGYPPGMPLPPGLLPSAFMPPPSIDAQSQQPHVIRDPNAGPRVDSEPVWLYLELCERDEAIRRSQRLPLDILAEEQKAEVEAEIQGLPIPAPQPEEADKTAETGTGDVEAAKDDEAPIAAAPSDPLPRHLIGMDKGRPVRHLGSWIYDSTVDPLFPAELLARNVGATLEVRIPGTLLSSSSRRVGAGPVWPEYLRMEAECLARCQVGEELKAYMDGESCQVALNGHADADSWKLGWRGKEHARMSLEMRIEERMAEAQLFSDAPPPQEPAAEEDKKTEQATDEKDAKPADEEMPPTSETEKPAEDKPEATTAEKPAEDRVSVDDRRGDGSAWDFWRLNPLLRRKLWGTDVYTDDSDVLAMCVHAGWVEGPSLENEGVPAWVPPGRAARAWAKLGASPPTATSPPASKGSAMRSSDLSVVLRIAPKLIAYKGCQRGGLKSRSWGNTHDGVSLVVESVELKPPGYAHGKGRSSAKRRIDQLAWAAGATTLVPATKRIATETEPPSEQQAAEPPRYFWDVAVRA